MLFRRKSASSKKSLDEGQRALNKYIGDIQRETRELSQRQQGQSRNTSQTNMQVIDERLKRLEG